MLGNLSRREKILVTGLLAVAIAFCFSYFIFMPQLRAYGQVKNELAESRAQLARAQATASSLRHESNMLEKVKEQVQEKERAFDNEMRGGYNIILLGMKQAAENIAITGVEPGKIKENPHSLEIPVKFEARGDFRKVLSLCKDLDRTVGTTNDLNLSEIRNLKVESLSDSAKTEASAGSGGVLDQGVSSGAVKVTMGIVIFSSKNPEGRAFLEETASWLTGRYNIFRTASLTAPIPELAGPVDGSPGTGLPSPVASGRSDTTPPNPNSETGLTENKSGGVSLKSPAAHPEPEYLMRK